jgi:hypothetical protein
MQQTQTEFATEFAKLLKEGQTTNTQLQEAAEKLKIPLNAISWRDKLYDLVPKPGGYIINMESCNNKTGGTHWVAIFLTNEKGHHRAYYFDSFGVPPPVDVLTFARSWGSSDIIHSRKQIQQINSNFCGQYCLHFLKSMSERPIQQTPAEAYSLFLNKYKTIRHI